MEDGGHSHYVAQLKAEFDGCDTTATGFLDRDELTELCRRLQLDAQRPLLLHTLLGERTHSRVNFEEFKERFVEVLSRSLDLSTSEDDSSYLDSAVFEEMKPKFVKGAKRYGRRSRPDSEACGVLTCDSEDSPSSRNEATDASLLGVRRAKERRSTSLESVESLKSDEDTGSQKNIQPLFQCKGEEEQLEAGGGDGVLTAACGHLSLQHLHSEDMNGHLCRTEAQLDGRVSITEFRRFLSSSSPTSRSTPKRVIDLQRPPHRSQALLEERPVRSAAPSLLTATVGQRVLSRLDDGSGCTSPEWVAALWTEEGIQNSRDILQTLDFSLEDRLSLADLTLALDNELLVSGNGIHQAALISYKNEIQLLQEAAEQACRERDKLRADLEEADHRNLQLVREVDDRHASMETLNRSRIRDLEQDFRDRLTTLRCEAELESEVQLQQGEQERRTLQEELQLLRAREVELQEELCNAAQENQRLEEELSALKEKLAEAETSMNKLQADLSQLLLHKFGGLDPAGSALSHEERVSELINEYELRCRVLQDRNDELSLELERLKNPRSKRSAGGASALSWKQQHAESDDWDMDRSSPPPLTQSDQKPGLDGSTVSIQTELAVEQLQQKHQEELQQLSIQLETQMNFYERSLEKMRESMEVERKDISQAFKLEISELEEQKTLLEQEVKQLKAALDKLQKQTLQGGGGGWSSEQERRMQRERAELEQNFAREIGNLVQRLSSEKEQLEAELKLKMDQEVMAVKTQLEEARSDNQALQERLSVLQHEVQNLEEDISKKRRRLEELEQEHQRSREEEEHLHKENSRHREEVLDLSSRNLKLSSDNGELSARLRQEQESVRKLQEMMTTMSKQTGEEAQRLQEEVMRKEQERLQQQEAWRQERRLLEEQLSSSREKLRLHQQLEAELSRLTMKMQQVQEDKQQLQKAADGRQEQLLSVKEEAELLRSQLHTVTQEKAAHTQEVVELKGKLLGIQSQVEELHGQLQRLRDQEEEVHRLMVQNQQLLQQVSELQVQELQVHKLSQDQQTLKSKLSQAESARTQALDQAAQADAALTLLQAQLQQQKHELQGSGGHRERAELLQVQLDEEVKRSRQLEENLNLQVQQSRSQISMKQEQYEKAMSALQRRVDDLEVKLKGVRLVLQEKVQELKEQLVKSSKTSALLKDVYVENSQLMKALQVTERRQKLAERRNILLEEKVGALHQLLRDIVPAALAT